MANVNGTSADLISGYGDGSVGIAVSGTVVVWQTQNYIMVCQDAANANIATWTATGSPDATATTAKALAAIAAAGLATPVRNVRILHKWLT